MIKSIFLSLLLLKKYTSYTIKINEEEYNILRKDEDSILFDWYSMNQIKFLEKWYSQITKEKDFYDSYCAYDFNDKNIFKYPLYIYEHHYMLFKDGSKLHLYGELDSYELVYDENELRNKSMAKFIVNNYYNKYLRNIKTYFILITNLIPLIIAIWFLLYPLVCNNFKIDYQVKNSIESRDAMDNIVNNNKFIASVDLKKEYVLIENRTGYNINMTGWKITDRYEIHVYCFGFYILKPYTILQIQSGDVNHKVKKIKDYYDYIEWSNQNIWNDKGDTLYIYDNNSNLILMETIFK